MVIYLCSTLLSGSLISLRNNIMYIKQQYKKGCNSIRYPIFSLWLLVSLDNPTSNGINICLVLTPLSVKINIPINNPGPCCNLFCCVTCHFNRTFTYYEHLGKATITVFNVILNFMFIQNAISNLKLDFACGFTNLLPCKENALGCLRLTEYQ